ncbi:class I SAM-dependent methyltransferase [Ochrovirga pacifica]|uniref:class I SAM-dependent methyltransferase n=1 Tax=Ochrovirga pacifica TaxID=1042376 RepID=UPI0002557FC9|nr:class I SAM-dependent methyltransferase [Ochrovirga pacifica]
MAKRNKTPWPTKAVMEQIYDNNLWGGATGTFYSGEGSHHPNWVKPYQQVVIDFLMSFSEKLVVCDLGCGDFNVGNVFVAYAQKYIAVDIVADLIHYNQQKYKQENLTFYCLDIANDTLPNGDCVIIRQVLQHLSNKEIQNILKKLSNYSYAIITEHIPNGNFQPNIDIISGQGIRIKKKSGVAVLEPPFLFNANFVRIMHTIDLEKNKGRIVTTLYKIIH